jgi:hypothetical protein
VTICVTFVVTVYMNLLGETYVDYLFHSTLLVVLGAKFILTRGPKHMLSILGLVLIADNIEQVIVRNTKSNCIFASAPISYVKCSIVFDYAVMEAQGTEPNLRNVVLAYSVCGSST